MTQHPYTYTILRYLHDPRAGDTHRPRAWLAPRSGWLR
jgi:hypothetical protein